MVAQGKIRKLGAGIALITALATLGAAPPAQACTGFSVDNRTPTAVKAASKPVIVDKHCRTMDAGVYDDYTLGVAKDLGNERVFQSVGGEDSLVLVADCTTREATMLLGPVIHVNYGICSNSTFRGSLAGGGAVVSLSQGDRLNDLVEATKAAGGSEIDPIKEFFVFTPINSEKFQGQYKVGRKDRFDLLCGCKIHYPDSAGARP